MYFYPTLIIFKEIWLIDETLTATTTLRHSGQSQYRYDIKWSRIDFSTIDFYV